jgi:hypothetical protein
MVQPSPTRATRCASAGVRAVIAACLLAVIVAGCGAFRGQTPAPTPADFAGVVANFSRRGITVQHVVSGDAGCADQALARTAISFEAQGADQSTPVTIYLYSFADREAFDRLRPAIDACARSYVRDPEAFDSIDAAPFVLAGQGPWGANFKQALRASLEEAAQQGG